MHLNDGQIRAYLDQELIPDHRQKVIEHLDSCDKCQQKANRLRIRSQRITESFNTLVPDETPAQLSTNAARARLSKQLIEKEVKEIPMWRKFTTLLPRTAWIALGVVLLLAIALTFAPVRAVANTFLGLFRVEQIRVVQVNTTNLPEQFGSSSQLEYMLSKEVQVEEKGEPVEVASAAEASAMIDMPVRLPTGVEGPPILKVQPAGNVSFNIDLELVQTILNDIGRSDIELPPEIDGATVEIEVPPNVVAQYGECDYDFKEVHRAGPDPDDQIKPRMTDCTTLIQGHSPSIYAPPGLDIAAIGSAFLQVMGMDAEEAAQFAKNVDWTTTLVIPIPRYGTEQKDVLVDGVTGTLILQALSRHEDQFLLLWVKDTTLYALTGPGGESTALEIANSLK
jgi:hypothetical protein